MDLKELQWINENDQYKSVTVYLDYQINAIISYVIKMMAIGRSHTAAMLACRLQ